MENRARIDLGTAVSRGGKAHLQMATHHPATIDGQTDQAAAALVTRTVMSLVMMIPMVMVPAEVGTTTVPLKFPSCPRPGIKGHELVRRTVSFWIRCRTRLGSENGNPT